MTAIAPTSLPKLDDRYALPANAPAAYQRDGHVLLRGVCSSAEVAAYRPYIAACVRGSGKGDVPLKDRDAYHRAFLQIANLWELDQHVARFVLARRFARIAAELMGVPGVRLYHDQALFKEPGGGVTFWHQDQYYWPLETPHAITMWMPLADCDEEMGVLTFASRSHENGPLVPKHISTESDAELRAAIAARGYPIASAPLRVGDATFHTGWTAHAAGPNQTDRMREVMTIIYFADGTRIAEPDNPHRPADLARWLPGQKPGEVAASRLNPLIWQAGMGA